MTKSLVSVNTAADTFQVLIDRTNALILTLANEIVTVNSSANGVGSSGNGYIVGSFGANTLFATTLRGGNLTTSGLLSISSNLTLAGLLTVSSNATIVNLAVANVITLGANLTVNTSSISIGNSTVNTVITSAGILNSPYLTVNNRTSVKSNNVSIGVRSDLNFIGAGAATVLVVDNANNNSVDVTVSISGNSVVAGANTQIQYNDQGSIAASSNLTFDKTQATLSTNNVVASTYSYKNSSNTKHSFVSTLITSTSLSVFDSFFITDYRGAEYLITVKDNNSNTYQLSKVLILHDGVTPLMTEYGLMYSNTVLGDFSVSANVTHIILSVVTLTSNTLVKATKNLIEA